MGILGALLSQYGGLSIAEAFRLLLVLAIVCAFAAALLRTWGSAYLGAKIVESGTLHMARQAPAGIIEAGPYRYVRNPLYLGTILHTLALALVMPGSGAIFILVVIPFLQLRLILIEESFLREQLGTSYESYLARVPRLLPALRPRISPRLLTAHWPQAALGEIYMWGVAISFAMAGWWYNPSLLIQCVVISFGLSLVIRALVPRGAKS